MKWALTILAILFSGVVGAKPIEITVTDYGWITSFPAIRNTLDFYLDGIEDQLSEDQPIRDPSRVNYGVANSSVLASKGLGTDYVNEPEKYLISLGIGGAWDAEKDKGIKEEISGAASASSLTLGAPFSNLVESEKIFGLYSKRLMGFVNFGYFSHSQDFPGKDIDIAGDLRSANFGVHFYDLVEKLGTDFWGWSGIKVHTGYEFNHNDVDLETTVNETLEVDTGGLGVLSGNLTGNPTFNITTTTHSFPLEFSTGVLLLNVMTVYGGYGADFNFGRSKGEGDAKGDVLTLACTSGLCVGETVLPQAEVQVNYDAEAQVKNVTSRSFAGIQFDFPFRLSGYVQATHWISTKVRSASAGVTYTY